MITLKNLENRIIELENRLNAKPIHIIFSDGNPEKAVKDYEKKNSVVVAAESKSVIISFE